MALHIARPDIPINNDEHEVELVGIRLDRPAPPRYRELVAELEGLRAVVEAKDAHITSLECQVWAWRSQASNEIRAHRMTRESTWDRECELIRVIHRQALAIQQNHSESDGLPRRWWTRSA